MTSLTRRGLPVAVWMACQATPLLAQATGPSGQQLLSDWMDILISGSRLLIVVMGGVGIVFAGLSMFKAYDAQDDRTRTRHLGAALFAGVITITGVVIGWISGILVPV